MLERDDRHALAYAHCNKCVGDTQQAHRIACMLVGPMGVCYHRVGKTTSLTRQGGEEDDMIEMGVGDLGKPPGRTKGEWHGNTI